MAQEVTGTRRMSRKEFRRKTEFGEVDKEEKGDWTVLERSWLPQLEVLV